MTPPQPIHLEHKIKLSWKRFLKREVRERKQRREAERLRREWLLQRGRELEFNFRVNLIWVGWVNFNLGGFFLFGLG